MRIHHHDPTRFPIFKVIIKQSDGLNCRSRATKLSLLWQLVWGKSEVDPALLSEAIERELIADTPDFRTRLLIKDGTQALEHHWGAQRVREWLSHSPVGAKIHAIQHEDLG